jgi:HD-GYP domain-containing protein (c-di-GMP phosphodiesterase class II)
MDTPAGREPTQPSGIRSQFTRALDSPIRVRVHGLIAVAALAVILTLWITSLGADDRRRDLAAVKLEAVAADTAAEVDSELVAMRTALAAADVLLASGTSLSNLCPALAQDAVRHLYRRLNVFSTSGSLLCSTIPDARDQPDVIRQRGYFQAALSTGVDQVDGPLTSTITGRTSIAVAHPLRTSGTTRAVVTLSVDASEILNSGQSLPQGSRGVIMSPQGAMYEVGLSQETPSPLSTAVVARLAAAAASTGRCDPFVVDGIAWECSSVGETGYIIAVGQSASEVFAVAVADSLRLRWQIAGVLALALVAGLLADILFVRRIRIAYGNAQTRSLHLSDTFARDEIDVLHEWTSHAGAELSLLRAEVSEHDRRRVVAGRELLTSIAEAVESRYPFLRQHGDRVGRYARQIGIRLGITGEDLDLLAFAGQIHDLGKIVISDAVYLKPARLEPIETTQMQMHATRGAEIAGRMRDIPERLAEAIRHHHERWDGAGYPDGLSGTQIPLWSRIISVADAYDAMTEERPYRARALAHAEAIAILRDGAGIQWDATAVSAFLDVIEAGEVAPKSILQLRRASSD